MDLPNVVSAGEWDAAQEALRAKEKAATSARDILAAERRRLPRLLIEKEYVLEGPTGVWSLLDVTPLGRQETCEDSPACYPQTPPYEWWRRHDEYERR